MDDYRCTICRYLYRPSEGDPTRGVQPGVPFEELADDWVCPWCKAGKENFEIE